MLIFIRQSEDDSVLKRFRNSTYQKIRELTGGSVKMAHLEGGALSEEKYISYCEAEFSDRDHMAGLMQSAAGKELNKDLSGYHKHVSVFFADYSQD